jgi:transcription antitermination factor NusG
MVGGAMARRLMWKHWWESGETLRMTNPIATFQNLPSNPEELPWYALQVRPRFEKQISQTLKNKGYEEFLPMYSSRRRWSDRFKVVDFPLFPGYLFCRLNPRFRLPIITIPGVLKIVGFGQDLVPVDESEIAAIQTIVKSGVAAEPWPYLKAGQRIRILQGALEGMEGILLKSKAGQRLIVSVNLLQRSVAVEIDANWATPVNQP